MERLGSCVPALGISMHQPVIHAYTSHAFAESAAAVLCLLKVSTLYKD